MRKHIGSQRFIYNWGLAKNKELYKLEQKKYSTTDLGKMLTQFKKEEEYEWLNEISNAIDKELWKELKEYSKETEIPVSKLLDKSISLFLKSTKK